MSAMRRWEIFTAAPHRMFFATGMAWLLLYSAWWAVLLAARFAGFHGFEPARPALLVHGGAMLFLAFTPFMFGFLLTVFPRWMNAPEAGRRPVLAAFLFLNAGSGLFLLGLWTSGTLLAIGWLSATVALAALLAMLAGILLRAPASAPHALTTLASLAAGVVGMTLFAASLASGDFSAWPLVRGLGLWGFLVGVYFGVCHRMIPFFSSRVVPGYRSWRPDWILYLFIALALLRAGLETAPAWGWLATVPMAGLAATCALRWRPRVRTGIKLLSVLHAAFAWLVLGLALAAAADLAVFAGAPGLFGRASLHAIGMGFFGGMLMAMVTRVTLGHSGRPLKLDAFHWALFLAIQGAAAVRVLAEFLPPVAVPLTVLAAVTWVGAIALWAVRNLPIYLRPREDGAPG
jgi:uncharacterized protein involved in response to NO